MLREIWNTFIHTLRNFGAMTLFFLRLLQYTPAVFFTRFRLVVYQVYNAGALSLVVIMISGLFVGGVLALLAYSSLEQFNAEDTTGIFAGLGLIKGVGPVFTALLFAGRAGTALTSEIGLMKATDQVDPLRYVAVPRFIGGLIAMPLLTAIFTGIGLFGAHLVAVEQLGVDVGSYWQQLQNVVDPEDVREGITKSIVFGFVASLVAVWEGYNSTPTAEGVGRATTRTVVTTSIAVLFFNYMITAIYL
jgi:phospholipid/cholesterol/gamma-HCH transport system permease protein